MKLTSQLLDHVVEIKEGSVTGLVIENGRLLRELVEAIKSSVEYGNNEVILSENGEDLRTSSAIDMIEGFAAFSINTKGLVSAALKRLEKESMRAEWLDSTREIQKALNGYFARLAEVLPHETENFDISIVTMLKVSGLRFEEDSLTSAERILEHMRLVRELLGDKLFVLVNCRSYHNDAELEHMFHVALLEKFKILMIDGAERQRLICENRILIDADLCEISQKYDEFRDVSLPENVIY